ncbi:MAG TPA: Co2+/Mg2+ efflux protein ApaG [Propylenella sp.]
MYSAITRKVSVTVEPQYLEDRSDPAEKRFFWAYTIEIANSGEASVQILARHWIITDQNGKREDVRGIGVVGEQPVIPPGASFTYTSGCPLPTPSGVMVGSYQAVDAEGELFSVAIPAFSLDVPGARRVLN